jgi:hypothetical protein
MFVLMYFYSSQYCDRLVAVLWRFVKQIDAGYANTFSYKIAKKIHFIRLRINTTENMRGVCVAAHLVSTRPGCESAA